MSDAPTSGLQSVLQWLLHSPRRLLLVALAVVAVVLVSGNLLRGPAPQDQPSVAATDTTSAAVVPNAARYVQRAVQFVQAWSRLPLDTATAGDAPQGQRVARASTAWLTRLAPLCTPELAEALATIDTGALPGVAPRGEPVVRFVAQDSALIAVPLADDSSVLVTVVDDAGALLVSSVEPDAGD